MSYRVTVSVDYKTKPPSLKLDPCELQIEPKGKQQIKWVLNKDDLPNGTFLPPEVDPPGFRLSRNRKDSPFSSSSLSNQGQVMMMFDVHKGSETAGRYSYRLAVVSEGQLYRSWCPLENKKAKTSRRHDPRVPSDPIIINKVKVTRPKPPKPPSPKKAARKNAKRK